MGHDFIDSSMVKVVPSHFSPPSLARKRRAEVFHVQGVLVFRVFRKIFNVVSDGLPVGFSQADIGGVDQFRGNARLQNRMIIRLRRIPRLFKPWMNAVKSRGASVDSAPTACRRITPTSVTKLSFHLSTSYLEKANEKRISPYLTSRGNPGTTGFSPWGSMSMSFHISLLLPINFSPVADLKNDDQDFPRVDLINDPVLSHAVRVKPMEFSF